MKARYRSVKPIASGLKPMAYGSTPNILVNPNGSRT